MKIALDEGDRRRNYQHNYNVTHGITPTAIEKAVEDILEVGDESDKLAQTQKTDEVLHNVHDMTNEQILEKISKLDKDMQQAAKALDFEKAASIRDTIAQYRQLIFGSK